MMNFEKQQTMISVIRGKKDKVLRRVDEIPNTFDSGYVDVFMRVNGGMVRQTVNASRIEKVRIGKKND